MGKSLTYIKFIGAGGDYAARGLANVFCLHQR